MGGQRPGPDLNEADAMNHPVLDVFVPDQGDRQGTAIYLTQVAATHGMDRHIQSDAARRGFWISNDLADVVYDDDTEDEPADEEPATQTPDKAPAKTGSTTKKKSQKGTNK